LQVVPFLSGLLRAGAGSAPAHFVCRHPFLQQHPRPAASVPPAGSRPTGWVGFNTAHLAPGGHGFPGSWKYRLTAARAVRRRACALRPPTWNRPPNSGPKTTSFGRALATGACPPAPARPCKKGAWPVPPLVRQPYTKPIPPGAEIITMRGKPHARFKEDGKTV